MITARLKVNKICKATDSKEVKLRKCFDWVAKAPYKRYRFLNKIYKQKGWESTFAMTSLKMETDVVFRKQQH